MYNIIGKVKKKKSTHRKSCFPIFCLLFDFFCLFSDCWWDEIFRLFLISTFLFCFVLLFLFFHPISDLCQRRKSLKKKKKQQKKGVMMKKKTKLRRKKYLLMFFLLMWKIEKWKISIFILFVFCFCFCCCCGFVLFFCMCVLKERGEKYRKWASVSFCFFFLNNNIIFFVLFFSY